MPLTAWRVDDRPAQNAGKPVPSILDRLPFTFPFYLIGQPAFSARCGFVTVGLRFALQIVGRCHTGTPVLQAAAASEKGGPWTSAWPEVP